jgi:hypothetical protein
MPDNQIKYKLREEIFQRAKYRCEYCLSPARYSLQPFVVEHIMPLAKGGTSDLENLACSCGGCNGHKYNKTEAVDPAENRNTRLFNPRIDLWRDHFVWSPDFSEIVGISSIGRASVVALQLNRRGLVNIRRLLLEAGEHPPVSVPEHPTD